MLYRSLVTSEKGRLGSGEGRPEQKLLVAQWWFHKSFQRGPILLGMQIKQHGTHCKLLFGDLQGLLGAAADRGAASVLPEQAEANVRQAAELALDAARQEVGALQAKAKRAGKRRRRLSHALDRITEVAHSPFLTHGEAPACVGTLCRI
jgi:hypothetical protein